MKKNLRWWILGAMTATISMIFVDVTVLPVVLPTLQRELGFSDLGLQWVVNVYTLVLAVLVLAGGRLGDMWGYKKTYCFGVICFATASALCGMSHTEWGMILSRALQGVGGAFLVPATQAIISLHFPPHERGKATGLYVSVGSIFLALGPLIGGTLTSYLDWRYVFWINLPIAAIGLTMSLILVPSIEGKKERFDYRGFLILVFGLSSIIIGLMQVQDWGWLSFPILFLLCAGCALLYFLFHRKHKPHASLIDFEVLKKKAFIASTSTVFCVQLLAMVTVFWAIYFQNILGYSPTKAGLLSFTANIPVIFAAPIAGSLVDRLGPRLPVMIGFTLLGCSLSWFLTFFRNDNFALLLPTLIMFGFGCPLVFTPSYVALINAAPADKRGITTGMSATMRQFSATLGLALYGSIYASTFFVKFGKALHSDPNTASLSPKTFEGLLSKSEKAIYAMNQLSPPDAHYVLASAKNAFLDAFAYINTFAVAVALTGFLIARRLLKNTPIH